jgi:hypothetical protein
VFLKKILQENVYEMFTEKRKNYSDDEWAEVKENTLKSILHDIIKENEDIKMILLKSYIRPIIITHLENNIYWKTNGIDVNNFITILYSIKINLLLNQESM